MSWQAYVDQQLVGSGYVKLAAIMGHDGSQWAASPGFSITPAEFKEIFGGFTNNAAIQGSGFRVGPNKYMTIRASDRTIYGKKGSTGVIAVKTNQAVLVGYHDENQQAGACSNVVEKLADYLIEQGY